MKRTYWILLIITALSCEAELDENELKINSPRSSTSGDIPTYSVGTLDSLKKVIEDNRTGSIRVYINSNIDITESNYHLLPITIANHTEIYGFGDQASFVRGEEFPAIRHTIPYKNYSPKAQNPIFHILEGVSTVKFFGLKFKGPLAYIDDSNIDSYKVGGYLPNEKSTAILAQSHVTIQECSFYYWNIGIWLSGSNQSDIRKNYIYYNSMHEFESFMKPDSLNGGRFGYGVMITGNTSDIKIEGNLFWGNRHDVSSDGHPNSSYEAKHNIVRGKSYGSNFDVHSITDVSNGPAQTAGRKTIIENNIWYNTTSNQRAVAVRGIPEDSVLISNNYFGTTQKYFTHENSNTENYYPAYDQVKNDENWEKINEKSRYSNNYFSNTISGGIEMLLKGNFDSDSQEELLLADGKSLYVGDHPDENDFLQNLDTESFPSQIDANTTFTDMENDLKSRMIWKFVAKVDIPANELRVGNFDGDAADEVFYRNGGDWNYFDVETGDWNDIDPIVNSSSWALDRMIFGDVSGDEKTDILCYSYGDSKFYVYEGGQYPKAYSIPVPNGLDANDFLIGDFNGDGKDELFKTNDIIPNSGNPSQREWEYYDNNTKNWILINSSKHQVYELALGEFEPNPNRANNQASNNADRIDIFSNIYDDVYNRNEWKFTVDGRTNWKYLNYSNYDVSNLLLLKFDGDNFTDAISKQNGTIAFSRNCQVPWLLFPAE